MEIWLPIFDPEICTACGLCVTICPTKAVMLADNAPKFKNQSACTYCGLCEEICPAGAVNLEYEILLDS